MSKIRQVHRAGRQRNLWLVSGSVLAAATASVLMPGQVFAQQIQGGMAVSSAPVSSTPPVAVITTTSSTVAPANGDTNTAGINVAASANYFAAEVDFRPGTARDEVELFTPGAIINWTTNTAGTAGGEVTFLGSGQQLNFTSALNDYTVLNRIFTPTIDAAVRIDGTVTSNTLSGSGQGGNVWFYGPGAQISALGPNSYLAIVAPRVEQGGSVNVNGSVAFVGAERAQLTINNGLFDISIGIGSADANGVVHSGTSTGAASAATADASGQISDADARGIYMVAVPKNTAIQMLVGGTVGYQPAEGASLAANGSIILSAGTGTTAGGSIANPVGQVDLANAVSGGNIVLDGATLASSAEIYASDIVNLAPGAASAISAGSDGRGGYDLSVTADGGIALSLAGSGAISIDGDLTLKSAGDIDVDLTSAAGTMVVGGNFVLDTQARGSDDFFTIRNNGGTGIGADAVSGAINLTIGGGSSLDVGGNLVLNSAAQGGKGELQNGLATAGDIAVDFSTTGTIDIGGLMLISAEAISAQFGKIAGNGLGGIGSDNTGGNITLTFNTGGLNAGGLFVNASAEASSGDNSAIAQSNDAIAGVITINILGGFNQLGQIDLLSRADGAASFDASGAVAVGQVTRGSASLSVTGAGSVLAVAGDAFIDVSTDGAVAAPSANSVSITVDNVGRMGGMFVDGSLRIDTTAGGGANTGVTTAGSVLLQAADGELSTGFLDISARASESARNFSLDGTGQDFQGGDVTLRAGANGLMNFGFAFIDTAATGAVSSAGDAIGGSITLEANDGAIRFQSFGSLNAGARGGSGADLIGGGTAMAQGGNISVSLSGTAGSMDLGDVFIGADASILFDVESGSNDFSGGDISVGDLNILADGIGGDGASGSFEDGTRAGSGGDAVGATAVFNALSGTLSAASITIAARGNTINGGGSGGSGAGTEGGNGGNATGGSATFNLDGSAAISSGAVLVSAEGFGGAGGDSFATIDAFSATLASQAAGFGGNGTGGAATFNNTSGLISFTSLTASAAGIGGNGGAAGLFQISAIGAQGIGGNGQGGNPLIELLDGSPGIITLGDVGIVSAGVGGTGATGGISLGGRIDIRDLSSDAGGNFTFNSLTADVIGDISYAFDGDGQLVVGGATQLTATGSILITHTNNAGPVISLSSGGNFTANAGLDFLAGGQSIISSGNVIAVRAEGSAQANDLQALSFIDFSAGLNAAVNNASVIGPAVTVNVGAGTAADDRRGFTANSLTINPVGSATVIVINGTVGGLTGFDALGAAEVSGLFDAGSTINGCLILNTARCAGRPGFDDPGLRYPIQDLIDEEIDPRIDDRPGLGGEPGLEPGDDLGGILVEIRQPASMREDPLLDDPVTGAGNEDLWVSGPDCDGVDADSEACREPVQ